MEQNTKRFHHKNQTVYEKSKKGIECLSEAQLQHNYRDRFWPRSENFMRQPLIIHGGVV